MLNPVDWSPPLQDAVAWCFGYLCGSIPFGLLLTRLAGGPDIRTVGSGNIGATNVLRTGRKGVAAATLLGDTLKGTVAVLIASHWLGRDAAIAAGFGAFLGHLFPVWLGFQGGKGVATFIGLLLGFKLWLALGVFAIVWLGIAAVTRYASLAGMTASAAMPVVLWWQGDGREALLFLVLGAMVWLKHRANIARLLDGTESKIGGGAASAH
jgi:acyl phosphate:glycerol-3-phosphate acyltransferase